jgi:hypothetical protein
MSDGCSVLGCRNTFKKGKIQDISLSFPKFFFFCCYFPRIGVKLFEKSATRKDSYLTIYLFPGGRNFYRFPRTAHLQEKWLAFTRQKNVDPKEAYICEDHFDEGCLEK